MKKNQTGKLLYVWSEVLGKTAITAVKVAIVAYFGGLALKVADDIRDRRAEK